MAASTEGVQIAEEIVDDLTPVMFRRVPETVRNVCTPEHHKKSMEELVL
jgi:hypothetical protein